MKNFMELRTFLSNSRNLSRAKYFYSKFAKLKSRGGKSDNKVIKVKIEGITRKYKCLKVFPKTVPEFSGYNYEGFVTVIHCIRYECKLVAGCFGLERVNGLRINREKTEILLLDPEIAVSKEELDVKEIRMAVTILGIHFTYNNALFRKLNFDSIMKSIKKSLNNWKWRGLTLIGKIQIIKSFVVPKILYRAAVLPLEKDLKEIISVLYEFLWKGKDKVKRTAVISDIRDGGLRMVDIETMIKAQQIMVVKKYLDNSPTGWKNILSFLLRKVGGPFLFHCNFELDSLPLDLPVFYRNCLDAWSSINKSSPATSKQIANEILWNNKIYSY